MFCSKCGKENADDAKFCSSCGTNIGILAEVKYAVPASGSSGKKLNGAQKMAIGIGVLMAMGLMYRVFISFTHGDVFVDTDTNLMWQDNSDAKTIHKDWQGAMHYCENLSLAGFDDWRLPDRNILLTLYTKRERLKNLNSIYWSSSSAINDSDFALYVGFNSGDEDTYNKRGKVYVRCVRDSREC